MLLPSLIFFKSDTNSLKLEETLAEHANDGWEFVGQYDFTYDVEQTGCFGGATGKKAQETQNIKQLVFRMQI